MKKAGLLEQPKRGHVRLTSTGKQVLADAPTKIDVSFLEKFPSFVEFRTSGKQKVADEDSTTHVPSDLTPDEVIDKAFQGARAALADELLGRVKNSTPAYFERLVVHS